MDHDERLSMHCYNARRILGAGGYIAHTTCVSSGTGRGPGRVQAGMGALVLGAGCRGLMRQASAIVSAWMKCPTAVADRAGRAMCGGGAMLAEAPSPARAANQQRGHVLEAVHSRRTERLVARRSGGARWPSLRAWHAKQRLDAWPMEQHSRAGSAI